MCSGMCVHYPCVSVLLVTLMHLTSIAWYRLSCASQGALNMPCTWQGRQAPQPRSPEAVHRGEPLVRGPEDDRLLRPPVIGVRMCIRLLLRSWYRRTR